MDIYADQTHWAADDFYELNRYLNKLFLQRKDRQEEFTNLDFDRMSEETRVLIRIHIETKKLENDLEDNLRPFLDVKPLKKDLYLKVPPYDANEVYLKYNVRW